MSGSAGGQDAMDGLQRRTIRRRALISLPIIVAIHLWLDLVYRSWVAEAAWNDWGLASSFTQITAILGISCLMVLREFRSSAQQTPPQAFFIIVPTLAMMAYEILQIWLPTTFDIQDLIYCLVGGGINWMMLKLFIFRGLSPDKKTLQ